MRIQVEKIRPYSGSNDKKVQIESMFDNIAHRYDFLNHLLSAGIDILWRKRAIQEISIINPKRIMDMATGTGDFAFEALKLNPEKIVAVDLSQNMLDVGILKNQKRGTESIVEFVKGDSEKLDFEDESFDAVTVGFGVRNFENLKLGLSELARVTRAGGMIAILEPSFPTNPLVKFVFKLHFKYLMPVIGRIFSRDPSAYSYLHNSVEAFPEGEKFCEIIKASGFRDTKHLSLSFGICALYLAYK